MAMDFVGVIIEESLEDKSIIKNAKILKTEIEVVTESHKTPWVNKWTMHTVAVPPSEAEAFSKALSAALDKKHNWYADLKNDTHHYIIFSGRVFYVDRSKKEEYANASKYGVSIGIPSYQLDFSRDLIN